MRLLRQIGIVATLAAATPMTAWAAQDGITYDCDTAANHYSELVLPAPATNFIVTGRVRLITIAESKQYVPLARLTITSQANKPGDAADNFAGFELSALPAKALGVKAKDDAVLQFVKWSERKSGEMVKHMPVGLTDDSVAAAFSLTYDGTSVVTNIGGREQRMTFAIKDPVVRLVCSTGEFLFTNLKIEARN